MNLKAGLIGLLCLLCASLAPGQEAVIPPVDPYPSVPGELRGVWMCNYAEPSWQVATQSLAQANFNALFPYMMSGGTAYYRSQVIPVHPSVETHGDYLAEAVAAAHAVGLPIYPRMLNMTTLFAPPAVKRSFAKQGRLMRTASGKTVDWLCPSNTANRKAQVAAARELLAYGVDGIQFDYFRYPSADACFCGTCRRAFERDLNLKVAAWPAEVRTGGYRGRFADWRREQLTSLVAEISAAVKQMQPTALVSAAVFLNWESHREEYGQDWLAWVQRGLVDFVCPMNYTTTPQRFELYVTRQEQWLAGQGTYASGIGVYADGYDFQGPKMALEQIRVARAHGSKGFVIFNYSPALLRDYLPSFAQTVTREPTVFQLRGDGGR